jgi:hypothetical protein
MGDEVSSRQNSTRPSSTDQIIDEFKKSYKFLIEGNEKDRQENLKKAEFYQDKIKYLKKLSSSTGQPIKNLKEYNELVTLYKSMYLLNITILNSINNGKTDTAKNCMIKLPEIEERIKIITGKFVERDWLTFQELEEYYAKGYKCTLTDINIVPFKKSFWDLSAERSDRNATSTVNSKRKRP